MLPDKKNRKARAALCAALIIIASLAALAYLPLSAIGQEKKSPPPGAPTDRDPQAYLGFTDEQIERLKSGELVILNQPQDLTGRKLVVAAMILDQDIETVWDLITQPWRQDEYIPGLHHSELVEKWDGGNRVDFQVRVMTASVDYRIIHTHDKSQYYSHWKLDPEFKNDMRSASGFYRFYWIDENHTLARYGTLVETKLLLPPKVQVFLTKQNLPAALGAVKKWVDSKGTYVKKGYEPDKN
jgi:hypothetical protein